jgi:hypothetical protein
MMRCLMRLFFCARSHRGARMSSKMTKAVRERKTPAHRCAVPPRHQRAYVRYRTVEVEDNFEIIAG